MKMEVVPANESVGKAVLKLKSYPAGSARKWLRPHLYKNSLVSIHVLKGSIAVATQSGDQRAIRIYHTSTLVPVLSGTMHRIYVFDNTDIQFFKEDDLRRQKFDPTDRHPVTSEFLAWTNMYDFITLYSCPIVEDVPNT